MNFRLWFKTYKSEWNLSLIQCELNARMSHTKKVCSKVSIWCDRTRDQRTHFDVPPNVKPQNISNCTVTNVHIWDITCILEVTTTVICLFVNFWTFVGIMCVSSVNLGELRSQNDVQFGTLNPKWIQRNRNDLMFVLCCSC